MHMGESRACYSSSAGVWQNLRRVGSMSRSLVLRTNTLRRRPPFRCSADPLTQWRGARPQSPETAFERRCRARVSGPGGLLDRNFLLHGSALAERSPQVLDDAFVRPGFPPDPSSLASDPSQVPPPLRRDQDAARVPLDLVVGDGRLGGDGVVLRLHAQQRHPHRRDGQAAAGPGVVVVHRLPPKRRHSHGDVKLADAFAPKGLLEVDRGLLLLKDLAMGAQDPPQRVREPPVVNPVEAPGDGPVREHEVEGVAEGDGRRQRRSLALLAEVADEDVGAERPAAGQQRRAGEPTPDVLDHRPQVVGVRGGVELRRSDREVGGAPAVEDDGADPRARRRERHVDHVAVLAAPREPGQQHQRRGVVGQRLYEWPFKPVECHCSAIAHRQRLTAVHRRRRFAQECNGNGLHVAVDEEPRSAIARGKGRA
mmetsp:Transcript_19123/g.45597  ORF Transcript_19123/g.45597 Transcript_19123/m.45597 type:complete len:425 (+) Transcript_19123:64-1338(+)